MGNGVVFTRRYYDGDVSFGSWSDLEAYECEQRRRAALALEYDVALRARRHRSRLARVWAWLRGANHD